MAVPMTAPALPARPPARRDWLVIDDRGRNVSRHRTEVAAWADIERRMRRTAIRANRPGMQGGGYASIQYAVCAPSREAEPPARRDDGGGGGADATSRRSDMLTRIFDAGPSGVSFRHLTDAKPGSREYLRAYNDLQVLKWTSCVECVGLSRERGRPYLWAVVTRERPDVEQSR